MPLIHIGIDPVIGAIGSFTISWHGLFMALAIIIGIMLAVRLARGSDISTDDIFVTKYNKCDE